MSPIPARERSQRIRASTQLWLLNILLGTAVGSAYLAHLPEVYTPRVALFAGLALVSTVVTLGLVPGLAFLLLSRRLRSVRALGLIQAVTWTFLQTLLFADTRIYHLWRYHFNGHVWNLIYTPGSEDSARAGWQVWFAVGFGLVLCSVAQYAVFGKLLARAQVRRPPAHRVARWLHPGVVGAALLLPLVGLEKTIYAQADLARDKQITTLSHLFPLYPRIPAKDFASYLGLEVAMPPRIEVEGLRLAYPRERPELDPTGPRPNVLIVVIDCWRRDMLDAEITPYLAAFAQECRSFEDHISGGNSTRFGLFSMLYGLHGSYWFPVFNERRSPVLVDALLDEDYDFRVFSSASMLYPELRDTAWVEVPDAVLDQFPGEESWVRDRESAAAFAAWVDERARRGEQRPFFGFVLVDSPHPTYYFPPDEAPFQPCAEGLNYLTLSSAEGPEPELLEGIRNRYKNAVRHADRVTGHMLEALREVEALDETLVIVTGDHGEEFGDNGFLGHTSNFTAAQVAVPFLLRGPGVEPGSETRPTSHLDVAPTLLELMGADPAQRGSWCLGGNLLEPQGAGRRRVISGWKELGLWTPEAILRVPLHDVFSFDIEAFDHGWGFLPDDREVLEAEGPALERLAEECNRFLD